MMSWPPDSWGRCAETWLPRTNTLVLVIAVTTVHGAIVMPHGITRLWWCNQAALRGEPSGSFMEPLNTWP